MSIVFVKISDKILYAPETGVVLKVSENIWIGQGPSTPENQNDNIGVNDFLYFDISSQKIDSIKIGESLSIKALSQKSDSVAITEAQTFSVFANSQSAVTITENVTLIIFYGSNIINGTAINEAVIS